MTVDQLIAKLQTYPSTALVVQSRDAEGNGFELVRDTGLGRYSFDDCSFGLAELTDEDKAKGYGEEDVVDGPLAVCIWP